MAEKWFESEVARGMQALMVLRLPGAPPEDAITLTLDVWLNALEDWIVWNEEQDTPRIQKAFKTLIRKSEKWPAPKHLIEALPERIHMPALPEPPLTAEERQRNKARLAKLLATLKLKSL